MIYTILVNWNGWRDTVECLDSLLLAKHDGMTVIVCDNASADDSMTQLWRWADERLSSVEEEPDRRRWAPFDRQAWERQSDFHHAAPFRFILLQVGSNAGFAGGNNAGIAYALHDAACRAIFILNNDTAVYPDTFVHLQAKLDGEPDIVICGPTLVYHDRRDVVQGIGSRFSRLRARSVHPWRGALLSQLPAEAEGERGVEFVIGAAMFIRPDFLRRTGGLSENYFLYYEEMDLSQSLRLGERIGWAKQALVAHKVGASIGTGGATRPSDLSIYYDHRSKIRFYWTYLKPYLPFLAAGLLKTVLAYGRKGDRRAIRAVALAARDFLLEPHSFRRQFGEVGAPAALKGAVTGGEQSLTTGLGE